MARTRCLVVDPEGSVGEQCINAVAGLDLDVGVTRSPIQSLEILQTHPVDLLLTEVRMRGLSGIEFLRLIQRTSPETDVVILATHGEACHAAQPITLRTREHRTKSCRPEDLRHTIECLLQKRRMAAGGALLKYERQAHLGFGEMVGICAEMQETFRLIMKVARRRHPVMIRGESGTGKELAARSIHASGSWHDKPFVVVDCGALSATLIESELFGHVRGAFTGAYEKKPGLLAMAAGGTVLLDEVADLPVELQAKLLRVTQEGEFRPIGGNSSVRLEARIIATTNRDLEAAVKQGAFRGDLYYRLNVFPIFLPPLRRRKSDIASLVDCFIDGHSAFGDAIAGITTEALARLMAYDWPGNVRELENCVLRALTLSSGPLITLCDLPLNLQQARTTDLQAQQVVTLRDLERQAIQDAVEFAGGDRLRAAQLLGIGKTTIYRKLRRYGSEQRKSTRGTYDGGDKSCCL
jgi:DNA-binding NtrC family response regulator